MNKARLKSPTVQEVTIGALMHDIGKLVQRGSEARLAAGQMKRASDILPVYKGRHSHWHALWTDAFFDWIEEERLPWPTHFNPDWVRDMAVYHHRPLQAYPDAPERVITELVTVADRLASGFERKSRDTEKEASDLGRSAFRRTPLTAIIPSLELDDVGKSGCHLPGMLNADGMLPEPDRPGPEIGDKTIACYAEVLSGFREGWRQFTATPDLDPCRFEECLLSLMEKWLWAVPSSTVDEPDISLFDHSRTVAAFTAALFHHHTHRGDLMSSEALRDGTRPKFRFLVGDLSGLQSTLFGFSRERVSGLNRILRGRSLRFQFIADAGIRQSLQAFDMPWSAALQSAGGRFLILLPELGEQEMTSRTAYLRDRFDSWLARNYSGNLGLGLALSDPFAPHDLTKRIEEEDSTSALDRSRRVRDDLIAAGETAKLRQLRKPAELAVQPIDYRYGTCQACGIRPAELPEGEGPEAYCATCRSEEELGRRYPKAIAVTVSKGDDKDGIFGLSYGLHSDKLRSGQGWWIDRNDNGPFPSRSGHCHVPRFAKGDLERFRTLKDHSKLEEGDIKTFDALALHSVNDGRGREMLALLKADVDRLGRLLAAGTGARWSIARASALSRMIDGYFSTRLPTVLKQDFPNIYTVFAGGDDLLLLGPWQDIFDFALKLRDDFCKFSLNNPSVTLSASISLFDVKAPVSVASREADMRLSEVKENGRNGISAIETSPMSWDKFREALDNARRLDGFIRDEILSTATLYRLLALSDAATRIADHSARPQDHAWRARLGYTLVRNLPNFRDDARQGAVFDFILRLFRLDCGLESLGDGNAGLRLALSHAIYRNRATN